ncbi:RNA-guided endonuclease TnpB family protein [Streptosporangium sp. NPDC006930]|uniref:RNA-guided endonuclease TnpB family protein n=1 Tax=Streptosporangium sp. NPDC006930 TaxID=3154783 RepID=UPI00342A3143
MEPLRVGSAIVATTEPHAETVLDTIRELGLEMQVIFNKGAVMVLPSGINKATGLTAALAELEMSAHSTIGVGDAENDHAFLPACECAVAVANALPAVKERCDLVTEGEHGAGVVELIDRILENDLADLAVDVPQVRTMRIVRLSARWGALTVPMVGRVRFRWTQDLPGVGKNSPAGKVTGARLIKEAEGWHVVFRTETLVVPADAHQGPQVGIDRGVHVALALSDGTMREHGSWLTDGEREHLRRLEKTAARRRTARPKKARPSGRERRTYGQIARLRAKAKRRAVDWQHQTTTELADTFAVIKVEKLSILNMVKSAKGTIEAPGRNVTQKAGLNRSISGQAWGRTVTLLEYKTIDRGGQVIEVPAPGTSQTCHRCGHRDPASRNATVFACVNPACGWVGHADTNAAININNADGSAVSGRRDLGTTRSVKRQPPRAA